MARKPRFNLIGVPQHVIQRGNNREPCFYAVHDWGQAPLKNLNCYKAFYLSTFNM